MQLVEMNYEIYDKELLAIVEALAKWRQYQGTSQVKWLTS